MFLKKLEIQGFKSFAQKISLNFKAGITAIVGPNGSGKSNISDAIKWVLGEQSPKTLRGEKMEDVIFIGTKNKAPLAFAEVSITIDNTDKKINLDFSEITITRKIYRSGESLYFINGSTCRLKDIHELFMDTGIGKEGYSIIGQGKIDAILSNKAEERRAIFEEAAGITKFKNRKLLAENKLAEVNKNLIRTTDIINELELQLEPLKIQAEKHKKYINLTEKLKIIKINIFKNKFKSLEQELFNINKNVNIYLENIDKLELDKKQLEDKQESFNKALFETENLIKNLNEQIENTNITLQKEKSKIDLNLQSITFIENDIKRLKDDNTYFNQTFEKLKNEINLLKISLNAKNIEYKSKEEEIFNIQNDLSLYKEKAKTNEENIKTLNKNLIEKMTLSSDYKNKLNFYKTSITQIEDKKQDIIKQTNFLNNKLDEKYTKKEALKKRLSILEKEEKDINLSLKDYNNKIKLLEENLAQNTLFFTEKNDSFNNLKNRQNILTELQNDFEGYNSCVKFILKERAKNKDFANIYGAVSEIIEVPFDLEIAIEIALGATMQNIITKTEHDAKNIINYLKKHNKGRATFLPLSTIKYNKATDDFLYKKEEGFIGIAANIVKFDEKFYNIINYLLAKTIVIDNLDNAIKFSQKYKQNFKIVTLDGQVISQAGALTGGSVFKNNLIFKRASELKKINENIQALNKEIDIIKNNILKDEQNKTNILNIINNKNNILQNIFKEKTALTFNIEQSENDINQIMQDLESLKNNENSLNDKLNTENIKSIENEINILENDISNIKNELLKYEDNLLNNKNHHDSINDKLNNLKIDINSIKNEINNINNEIDRKNNELDNAILKNDNNTKQIEEKLKEKEQITKQIEDKNNIINNLQNDYANFKTQYDDIYQKKSDILHYIQNCSNDLLNITKNISDIKNEFNKIQNKKENIENNIESITTSIWEEYNITYAQACNNFEDLSLPYEKLKKEQDILKNKISSLGNINLTAIEQYKTIKERYELNILQKDDILKSIDNLKNIINNLIKEMKAQFEKQFELINKNFKEVFSAMFGGGSAALTLLDNENVLSSGIDIVAKPPGKNLQSLALLSGGERALTAMSLLFAILKIKPSPFCILDEIEAALDDSNVYRYANFLKEFAKNNQFILITHKTGTMEVANTLYGVTMQEQGISTLVSVELKNYKDD